MRRTLRILTLLYGLGAVAAGPSFAQSVSAILEPALRVEIKSSVAGRIEAIDIVEGDQVEEGAVLARMDARVQRARVALAQVAAEAEGTLARAEIVVEQARTLQERVARAFEKGAAKEWEVTQSQQAYELSLADQQIARDQVARNQSQLALEEATLEEFILRAPFDSTVLETFVEAGAIVETDDVLMELGYLKRLSATAFVPVSWLPSITRGAKVDIRLESGEALRATLAILDPRIDPASQSVRVKLEIDNPDRTLLAGTAILLDRP